MRISDWSSDVCSSDLRPGGEACGHCRSCRLFGARAQRDPVEVRPDGSLAHPDGHSSHPDLLLVGYEWKLRPSPAKQRKEIVIDQMGELSARLGVSSGSESGTRVASVELADAVSRSDEHTSELQSLLRI